DESLLIWYSDKEEKQIKLSTVSKIIPGQRTATFQRYPRPEKEYQSFSLIYNDRSLDLICKDKEEAEIWFAGLRALVTRGNYRKWRFEPRPESLYSDSPKSSRRSTPSFPPFDPGDIDRVSFQNSSPNKWVKAFSEIISYTAPSKSSSQAESITNSSISSSGSVDNSSNRNSASEAIRISLSSAVSSSSQGSCHEDIDALGDVFIWGEGINDGILGGGLHRVGNLSISEMDAFLPKAL
ncbi:E3 ubiquitin-protein ligase HERC2-like, partial [Trifolium medium]|nr:E3 ubiquitin-protein ligase HERC2-like [Trifolium medium]